jgi:Rrf2 family nitric oxide-sensitive transcriptional repressor
MFLASHDGQHSIADIAVGYGISKNHLMKVAQRLVAEGFVESVRGRSGGLKLARPAADLNIGDIVRSMEDLGNFVECFNAATNQCVVTPACGLSKVFAGGVQAFLQHLDQFTVADLIADNNRFRGLLDRSITASR